MKKYTSLLQIHIRGIRIDAQCGEGGVVNLTVHAQEQHKSLWRRFRQHIANALFRAADACHPSQNHWPIRVVEQMVSPSSIEHGLPNGTQTNVRQIWPLHLSDGKAYYYPLLVHEGIKRHHDGRRVTSQLIRSCGEKSTDDLHVATYLKKQKWDGTPRLHNWLATVLGKDNTPELAKYGEILLLNIAERMLGKPSTQEKIIVFHGRQGLKKSTLLRVLAGDHFSDDLSAKSTPNVWIKEISEIDSLTKHEVTSIKNYLTNLKALRGNDPVFVGTSNTIHAGHLQRRFVTFHMTKSPDINWLLKNRGQLLEDAAEKVGT